MPDNFRGLAYALPENRYLAMPQEALTVAPSMVAAGGGTDPVINDIKDDLAYVRGLTEQYIDTRGKIEKYALDMKKTYGIDVTRPDYTQPGGGQPFRTYQELATRLLLTANDLKQSRKMEIQEAEAAMRGDIRPVPGFDPQEQPINRVDPSQRYFSTKLFPEVEQANAILRTDVYNEDDYKRFKAQVLDPLVAEYTRRMNAPGITPAQREALRYNINALVQKPYSQPYAYYQDLYNTRGRGRGTPSSETSLLRKITNVVRRRWEPEDTSSGVDADGNPIKIYKGLGRIAYGEPITYTYVDPNSSRETQRQITRTVDRVATRPDGSVWLEFEQPEGLSIPPEPISNMRPDDVTRNFLIANPRLGTVPKMYGMGKEEGIIDEYGDVIEDPILKDLPEVDAANPAIEKIKADILKSLKNPNFKTSLPSLLRGAFTFLGVPYGDVTTEFKFADGATETYVKKGGKWNIKGTSVDRDDVGPTKGLSNEDVIRRLVAKGYFDQFTTQSETQSTTPTVNYPTSPELPPLPNETESQYTLRLIRYRKQLKEQSSPKPRR